MLIGWPSQRRSIEELLAGARLASSGVLVVVGEPGAGKSALLAEAERSAQGMQILRARGNEAERDVPFGGLLQLLRPALHLLDDIPAPQAQAMGAALAMRRPGAPGDRFAIGAATLSLLSRLAESRPAAVLVDDLQAVDRPSAEAIVFAARRLVADPLAVLVAVRAGSAQDLIDGLPQLHLPGLDLAEARTLLAASPASLTEGQLQRLHLATAGNPLGMLELAGHPELWEAAAPGAPLPVPSAVSRAFLRRVDALGAESRVLLVIAAAAAGDVAVTAAAATRLGLAPDALEPPRSAGLVTVTDGRVEFRHPLLRSAVYADVEPELRRRVHAAIAAVLSSDEDDRRAWHLAEAAPGPDAAVAQLLAATARRARGRQAYAVAATAYQRAAQLATTPAAQVDLTLDAAESAWEAGLADQAVASLTALSGAAQSAAARRRVLQIRALIAARTGSLLEARQLLTECAEASEDLDEKVVLLADAVHVCFYLGDARGALALAEVIDRNRPHVMTTRARALGLMASGIARVLAGAGGADLIRAALPLMAASPQLRTDPRRLPWLMLGPLFLRDATSGADLRRLVDEARDACGVGTLPLLLFHLARDEATTDRWPLAAAHYAEATRLARETGQTTELVASMAGLAWLEARRGDEARCRALAAEALPICAERQLRLAEAWIRFALGDLALAVGNPGAAIDELQCLRRLLAELGFTDVDLAPGPELADALVRTGQRDEARAIATEYRTAARHKGQPWAQARAERAMGLVCPTAELDVHFLAALQFHDQTLDSFETARTRLAYGSRLRRARRRLAARPQLQDALATFDRLGAPVWSALAATELRATGGVVVRGSSGGLASLTAQELQVAQLLGEGSTTRQAAAALFLSPKTVEYHLRHVYTKLDIRSRTELAAAVAREDARGVPGTGEGSAAP